MKHRKLRMPIRIILSILCLLGIYVAFHSAAVERSMSVMQMFQSHIFGGEWLVALAFVVLIVYIFIYDKH